MITKVKNNDDLIFSFPVNNEKKVVKKAGTTCKACVCNPTTGGKTAVVEKAKLVVPKVNSIKELFSTSVRWTKNTLARTSAGASCGVTANEAAAFCLLGAVERVYGMGGEAYVTTVKKLGDVISKYSLTGARDLVCFNDSAATTFVDVQRVVALADV